MPNDRAGLELRLDLLNNCLSEISKIAGENWIGRHLHLVGLMGLRLVIAASKNERVTVKTLSTEVANWTSEATAIRVLKKMEENGLISTQVSKTDKRSVIIQPTEKIKEISDKVGKKQDNILARHGYQKTERPAKAGLS